MAGEICYPDSTDWSCLPVETFEALDPAVKERAEALAWSTLAALTAYQIGTCPVTVRPCLARCNPMTSTSLYAIQRGGSAGALGSPVPIGSFTPRINTDGFWVNSCGCTGSDCSCTALCEALLPAPVGSIVEVMLDGAVLDPSAYRVDNGYRLVRTDGECWPSCQDMSKPARPVYEPVVVELPSLTVTFTRVGDEVTVLVEPDPELGGMTEDMPLPWPQSGPNQQILNLYNGVFVIEDNTYGASHGVGAQPVTALYLAEEDVDAIDSTGTFTVRYYRGVEPNVMTTYAAGVLAWEFYQACSGNDCRLPAGVTGVVRQGITIQIATGLFQNGMTGIREVDAVIGIYNPFNLKAPPVVTSPDRRPARMTTWGG